MENLNIEARMGTRNKHIRLDVDKKWKLRKEWKELNEKQNGKNLAFQRRKNRLFPYDDNNNNNDEDVECERLTKILSGLC